MNPDYGNLNKPSGQTPPPIQLPVNGKALPGKNLGEVRLEDLHSLLFPKSSTSQSSFSRTSLSERHVALEQAGESFEMFIKQKLAKQDKLNEKIETAIEEFVQSVENGGGDSGDPVSIFKTITNYTKEKFEPIDQQPSDLRNFLGHIFARLNPSSSFIFVPSVENKKTSDTDSVNSPEAPKPSPKESDLKESAVKDEVKSESSSKYEPEVESVKEHPIKPNFPASDASEDTVHVYPVDEKSNSKIEKGNKKHDAPFLAKIADIIEQYGLKETLRLTLSSDIPVVSEDGTIYLDEKHSKNEEIQKFIEEKNLTPVIITEEDKEKMIEAFETIILPLLMAGLNEYLARQQASKEQPQAGGVAAEVEVTEDVTLSKMAATSDDKKTDKKGEKGKVDTVIIDPSAKIEAKKVERERQEKLKKEKYKKSIEKIRFYNTNERLREAAENADISNASLRAERVSKGGKI